MSAAPCRTPRPRQPASLCRHGSASFPRRDTRPPGCPRSRRGQRLSSRGPRDGAPPRRGQGQLRAARALGGRPAALSRPDIARHGDRRGCSESPRGPGPGEGASHLGAPHGPPQTPGCRDPRLQRPWPLADAVPRSLHPRAHLSLAHSFAVHVLSRHGPPSQPPHGRRPTRSSPRGADVRGARDGGPEKALRWAGAGRTVPLRRGHRPQPRRAPSATRPTHAGTDHTVHPTLSRPRHPMGSRNRSRVLKVAAPAASDSGVSGVAEDKQGATFFRSKPASSYTRDGARSEKDSGRSAPPTGNGRHARKAGCALGATALQNSGWRAACRCQTGLRSSVRTPPGHPNTPPNPARPGSRRTGHTCGGGRHQSHSSTDWRPSDTNLASLPTRRNRKRHQGASRRPDGHGVPTRTRGGS